MLKQQGVNQFGVADLDSWGEKCLARKKTRMANLLKIAEPDEALYREIMLALGYKNNNVQFLELSTITPYSEIKTLKTQRLITKVLLYRAGLSDDKEDLPKDFHYSLRMNKSAWNYKGIRPANLPEKRIQKISAFLSESCEAKRLAKIFMRRIIENYTAQLDKDKAIKIATTIGSLSGIGKQRSLEILFNIILPFSMALFEQDRDGKYLNFINELYKVHPPLPDNSITKAMKKNYANSERASDIINSVLQYMGLIEIHNQGKEGR